MLPFQIVLEELSPVMNWSQLLRLWRSTLDMSPVRSVALFESSGPSSFLFVPLATWTEPRSNRSLSPASFPASLVVPLGDWTATAVGDTADVDVAAAIDVAASRIDCSISLSF